MSMNVLLLKKLQKLMYRTKVIIKQHCVLKTTRYIILSKFTQQNYGHIECRIILRK